MQVINTCDRDISCWSCHRHHCGKHNSCKQWPHTYLASAWMSERFFIYLYFFFSVCPFSTIETFFSWDECLELELNWMTKRWSYPSRYSTHRKVIRYPFIWCVCALPLERPQFSTVYSFRRKRKKETFLLTFNWDACSVNNNAIDDSAIVVCFVWCENPIRDVMTYTRAEGVRRVHVNK